MANRSGWIKIHRSMLDHPLSEQLPSAWFRIWLVILMSTNWKPGVWWYGKKEVPVPAGSLVVVLDKLATRSGSGVQQVRSALDYFEATRMITREATHSYTKITIVNWSTYQCEEYLDNTPGNTLDNAAVTRQITTIEEDKNKRKESMSKSNSGELDLLPGLRLETKPKTRGGIDPAIQSWFESEFWPAYPRHEGKANALKAAAAPAKGDRKLDASTPEKRAFYLDRLKTQLPEYLRRKAESGQRVIPLGATWFNQDRADDELPLQEPSRPGRPSPVENDYPEYRPFEARKAGN